MWVPPTLKRKLGIIGASSAGHVSGSCLVSFYSHFHPPKPDEKYIPNTAELGPERAVRNAIIQFWGEREPVIKQVSRRHQMFSFDKKTFREGKKVVKFWAPSCVICDTNLFFVNENQESGVLLWSSQILQTGNKLHPVWSGHVLEAWVWLLTRKCLICLKLEWEFNLSSWEVF